MSSYAVAGTGFSLSEVLQSNSADELFSAFPGVMSIAGTAPQDSAWPGYRLMDANGVAKVFSDVTGPYSEGSTFSISSALLWSGVGQLQLQTKYADFGGTCDLNNPSPNNRGEHDIDYPPSNYGNDYLNQGGVNYQAGSFSTCQGNEQFSQNVFGPLPLLTREGFMYRACKVLSLSSSSEQIARLVSRIRTLDPTVSPGHPNGGVLTTEILSDNLGKVGSGTPIYNWCNNISAPANQDYQSLFRAFYPGRAIPKIPRADSQDSPILNSSYKLRAPLIAPAWARLLPSSEARAGNSLLSGVYTPAPQYFEKLVDVVNQSNSTIDGMSSADQNSLESSCYLGSSAPTLDKIKAVNAWRAILLTMCLDPGWQVL